MTDNPYEGIEYVGPSHDEAVAARGRGYAGACGFIPRKGGSVYIALTDVWPRNTRGTFRLHGEVVAAGRPTGQIVLATGYARSDTEPAVFSITLKK